MQNPTSDDPSQQAQSGQRNVKDVFEEQEDGCFRDLFEKARIVPFGIEPVITYLYLKNQEIRACRMVLVSKLYNLQKEKIAERVEYIYAY